MSRTDDKSLSCYLDGELDYPHAKEVTNQILQDARTRDRFIALATSQSLLRSYGQTELHKEVPSKLTQALQQAKRTKWLPKEQRTILQVAAVIVLFVASYLIGRNNRVDQLYQPSLVPVIPASLEQTINTVLEYQKSGSVQNWIELQGGESARITPVQSFRGSEGKFYRMYLIDMTGDGTTQQFWAMASRKGKENWQTKGVFATDTPGSI